MHAASVVPEGKRQLERTGCILDGNTKMNYVVGPCHHGMVRPQVVDRGTACIKEGNCE